MVVTGCVGSSFVFVFSVERTDRFKLHRDRLHDAAVAKRLRFEFGQSSASQQSDDTRQLARRRICVAGLHVVAKLGHLQKVEDVTI